MNNKGQDKLLQNNIYLPPHLTKMIRAAADHKRISISSYVRELIEAWFAACPLDPKIMGEYLSKDH